MKVLVAFVLALGSVSAIGSGPYLPSGWRPEGPAFYLPSEARKTDVAPLKEVIFQGSEASGSDFLREYGPPRLQNLPNEVTEQSFTVLKAKIGDEEGVSVEAVTEIITELRSALVEESASATTESLMAGSVEEVTALAEEIAVKGKSLNLEVESVAKEAEETTQTELINQTDLEATQATVLEQEQASTKIQIEAAEEVKIVQEGVKNIAEAITKLEQEVFAQQVQVSQDVTEFKSVEQSSGDLAQVPEGFLEYGPPGFQEYGPPGFKEYGPPKENALLRNAETTTTEEEKIENNETRRRRFSPKFRSTKKH